MAGNPPIIVAAGGLDMHYPAGNQELFKRVASSGGAIISEHAPGTPPTRHRFLRRARLTAAATPVTVIVEAGPRGGSMYAATEANRLGRRVLAVPGPITSAASMGTNELLRTGQATAVMSVDQLAEDMEAAHRA